MTKKNWPILALGIIVCILASCNLFANKNNDVPKTKYERILSNVYLLINEGHFSPQKFDNEFSKKVLKKFIDELDDEKMIFTKADLKLFKKFENSIDEEIKGENKLQSFYLIDSIYRQRQKKVITYFDEIASKPFNYYTNETIELDPKKVDYNENEITQKENWIKRFNALSLIKYNENLEKRELEKNSKNFIYKADSTLEREARESVLKQTNRIYNTKISRESTDFNFGVFVNAIAELNDPHTSYFPPIDLRSFNESMSGTFFGIGALLKEDDGKIKIASLVVGMPAWKQGELKENDEIIKIAQGNNEPVDVSGFAVNDAVKLIRGAQKGSVVKLTVKSSDGTIKIIPILRDEIKLEDSYAKSSIIQKGANKIGYIYLPEFYFNVNDPKGRRCATDIEKEIIKLKNEKIDGLVFDLRNNGGGSLSDVIKIVGMFIDYGSVVQVKEKYKDAIPGGDYTKGVLYDGPLTVLINEFSASASEIFAAAIQDYDRGIVLGSSSSYGKGTVQRQISLNPQNPNAEVSPENDFGSLKITLQKFYRVNGGATQKKGVESDIVIPDRFEFADFKEKDNTEALPWDEIPAAKYEKFNMGFDKNLVINEMKNKIANSSVFNQIKNNAQILENISNLKFTINLDEYKKEQMQIKNLGKYLSEFNKVVLDTKFTKEDEADFLSKDKAEKNKRWLEILSKDIYIDQAVNTIELMQQYTKSTVKN